MSDNTQMKCNDTDETTGGIMYPGAGELIYQPIRFSHEDVQWLETMQQMNYLLARALEAFRIPPELIGEIDSNKRWGTSQEELYRRRFG